MKHTQTVLTIAIMLLMCGTASAWLTGYDYRMPITVNNGGASELTYCQFNFTNDTNVLVAAGHMQASGADCRITDASDNLLPFWNETPFNAAGTKIWVNATTLAVGDNTFYMYYGNDGVSSVSNIGNTAYKLGDDFSSESGSDAGDVVWTATVDESGYIANHAIIKNEKIYATTGIGGTSTSNYLYIFNANTGVKITKIALSQKGDITAPVIRDNFIYVMECSDDGTGAFQKINLSDYTVVYTQAVTGTFAEEFAVDDTYAYLPLNNKISKVWLINGTEAASYTVSTSNKLYGSGTLLVDDIIYFRSQDGYLKAIYATNMTLFWQVALDRSNSNSYNSPIYISSLNYVVTGDCSSDRSVGTAYAINASNHSMAWKHACTGGGYTSIFTYANGRVFAPKFNADTGNYTAINATTGALDWSAIHIDSAWHAMTPIGGYIVNHCNNDKLLSLINASNGNVIWQKSDTFDGCCGIGIAYDGMYIVPGHGGLKAFRIGASGAKNDWLYKNYDIYGTGYSPGAITDVYLNITYTYPNNAIWDMRNTPTIVNNKLQCVDDEYVVSNKSYDMRGAILETNCRITAGEDRAMPMIDDAKTTLFSNPMDQSGHDVYNLRRYDDRGLVDKWVNGTYNSIWENSSYFSGYAMGNNHGWKWVVNGTSPYYTQFYIKKTSWDNVHSENWTHSSYNMYVYLGVRGAGTSTTSEYDWVFMRKYTSPEPTTTLGAEETGGGGGNDIVIGANKYGMLRKDVSSAQTFSTIESGFSHDVCFTWWDDVTDTWKSYWVGDSYNSGQSVPKDESYFVLMDSTGETVSCSVASAATVAIPSGWSVTYLRESDAKTLSAIKADMGGNCVDLYAWDHTASGNGAWTNDGSYTVLPNQGLLVSASSSFNWDGSVS